MPEAWIQNYDPTGRFWLSFALASSPIVVLMGLLGIFNWPAHRAAIAGLIAALALAIGVYHMPASAALASAGYGACFGLMPIGWIILPAVFLFNLTNESGSFAIVKASVTSLSADRRLQGMLVAFAFGAFIEGCAGFGTPVAITSALLIGSGFPPVLAAGLALIANTAPVAFGSVGIPIKTLATVTGLDELKLAAMAGRQLPFFAMVVPGWMVYAMAGWKGVRGVWPAILVCGGTFAVVQFLTSNYLGSELVDVASGLASIVALALMLRMWKPREIWRFEGEARHESTRQRFTARQIIGAWMPWVFLSLSVVIWAVPSVRNGLDAAASPKFAVPGLHQRVYRDVPAVEKRDKPEDAVYKFNILSATGTGLVLASIASALWMRVAPGLFFAVLGRTFLRMIKPLLTIAAMLAIAYTTRYSGADVTLGLAFKHTGVLYPFFAAILGWLGVALTGSDTSSNALFGSMQRITAEQLHLNPVLICAANSTGGVMGKMIDAQSIVVSAAATGQSGSEGAILRFVFWHSLILASLMGLLTLAQAYWLTWMIP